MSPLAATATGLELAVDTVTKRAWLDPVADWLRGAVEKVYRASGEPGLRVKNALHGTWLGHPFHPVLTDVPIGAWTAALVLDAAEAASGRRWLGQGADGAVAVGVAGALGAAATGLTDWQHTDDDARRAGVLHGLLNVGAATLFATSLVLRLRGARGAGRLTALLGFAVATGSAYLGGTLVYRFHVGVDQANRTLPEEFVPVAAEGDLVEGQPRRVEAGGVRIVLVRRGGEVHALAEVCSHLGGPLSEGRVEADSIVCPWHGSRFALADGAVLDGPATFSQPCLETRVRDGRVEVRRRQ